MIVTLLTDFGLDDHFVAAMKAVILARCPAATLVDVTHRVPPQDVAAGAFLLRAVHELFPAGTVHLAVVDPGVGSRRRGMAVASGGQLYVAPDNGLLTPVLDRPGWRAHELAEARFFRRPVSDTFHGRDVFAPVAGALAAGVDIGELGPEIDDPVRLPRSTPERLAGGEVRGRVLHVDRFGNCVTNLSPADVPDGASGGFRLEVNGRTVGPLRRSYEGAPAGEPFAIWGSSGLLEVSVDRGSAAVTLGAGPGTPVRVRPAARSGPV